MGRPLGLHQPIGGRDAALLQLLLQGALGILRLAGKLEGHLGHERAIDEGPRRIEAAVEEQRRHHGLVDVFERGMQAALARARLRGAEHDDVGESQLSRHVGERRAGDERDLDARQAAFVELMEALEGDVGDDGA